MFSNCCFLVQLEACYERKPLWSILLCSGTYFRGLALMVMEKLKGWFRFILNNRGCFGCCTKTPLIISVDEPSNTLKVRGQRQNRHHISEDFWSSSAREMDTSVFPSQRSISSISTSNQTTDPQSAAGSSSDTPEFVNHGLLLWNQTRQQWIGSKGSQPRSQSRDPKRCWNASYESLLGTSKPFLQPIPLSEMVDFLVDVWEQEGLYD